MTQTPKILLLAGIALAAVGFGCRSSQPGLAAPSHQAADTRSPRAVNAADQSGSPLLPDPKMTPGATLPVAAGDICVPGYTKKVRNVPAGVKAQVYAEYGIASHRPGEYEVDHLISLELGGANSLKNLWPQSYVTQPWNAHVKDKLENELHAEVCAGKIDLATAQHEIATDWIASYKKHFGTNSPLAAGGGQGQVSHPLTGQNAPFGRDNVPSGTAPSASAQVWVNTKSGKYFHIGSPYYGNTRSGQYMSEADAVNSGYVAAQGQ